MATKYVVLVIVIAYIALWALTSSVLGRDEQDDKMKSLWWMVGLFWPFVWLVCLIGLMTYLFGNQDKQK